MGPRHRLTLASLFCIALHATLPTSAGASDAVARPPAAADSSAGDSADYRLSPVVITAERAPVPSRLAPVDLSVIGPSRLETGRALFASDALRETPSLEVQRSGGLGTLTAVRVRGADPRHSLVLFDGIPLDGPWVGSYDFGDLMNPGIQRVEILGGPASSLYGSGAMGGVIQVLSPTGAASADGAPAAASTVHLFAEYGAEATSRQSARWAGAWGGAPAGATVTRLVTDGDGPRQEYEGWNENAALEVPFGDDRLKLSGLATQSTKQLPYDFTFDDADTTLSPSGTWHEIQDPNNEEKDRLFAGRAVWAHPLGTRAGLEGEASGLRGKIENSNDPNAGPGSDFLSSDMENSRGTLALRGRFASGSKLDGVLGGEYIDESVDYSDTSSYGGYASGNRVNAGTIERALFAQAHAVARGRVLFDAGFRLDSQLSYGTYGLPRVALGFLWSEAGVKLRGGYGRAFMAPTLSDLYFPFYGNPELRPERSTTWEAGADGQWLAGRLTAHVTWHTTQFIDLIQANSYYQAENIGSAKIEGEEFAVRYAVASRLSMGGSAAHLIATNLETGDPLPDRPTWQTAVTAQAAATRAVTVMASWRWVDAVPAPFDFVSATGEVLDGDNPAYSVVDLGAQASLSRWAPLDLTVRCTNLLDRDYSEVKGFPAPPRMVTVGVTYSFDTTRSR
jgi:vitamin B12 transporter